MKPDWKDAPAWANWLSKDKSGEWYWFECKPIVVDNNQWFIEYGRNKRAISTICWNDSLEKRPEKQP